MKVIKSIKDLTGQDLGYGIEEMDSVKEGLPSEKKSSSRSASSSDSGKPKAPASEKSVLSRLQNQCSKREFCRSDIFQKAKKAMDGDAAAATRIVDSLVKEKYVDDLRYASAFAREKSSLSGWGKVKISYMLTGKGIDKATIAAALEEIDPDSSEKKMESVLRAKFRTLEGEKDAYLKLLRFALSRGYNYDEVKPVVDTILEEYRSSSDDGNGPRKEEW